MTETITLYNMKVLPVRKDEEPTDLEFITTEMQNKLSL